MQTIKRFLSHFWELLFRPEMRVLPGQLAFFFVLSIFPMLTLLGYVGSRIDYFSNSFVAIMKDLFPADTADMFISFVTNATINGNEIVFMIIGFFLVSNGTQSLIVTSNELYGFEHKNYFLQKLKSIIMAIVLMLLFIFVILVLAYGNVIVNFIVNQDIFEGFSDKLKLAFWLLKWPVALIFVFLTIKFLYSVAPDARIKSRYTNKGAFFATLGWFLITAVYSWYVSDFSNYGLFYGSISNIVVMMIWIYLLSMILSMGIALNSNIYKLSEEYKNKKND